MKNKKNIKDKKVFRKILYFLREGYSAVMGTDKTFIVLTFFSLFLLFSFIIPQITYAKNQTKIKMPPLPKKKVPTKIVNNNNGSSSGLSDSGGKSYNSSSSRSGKLNQDSFTLQKGSPLVQKIPSAQAAALSPTAMFKKQLNDALIAQKNGENEKAVGLFFSLSRRKELEEERAGIKYNLGLVLMELKIYQIAAFQFVDIIRLKNSKYLKAAIAKLSICADYLGDETLLNYAISKVDLSDFPKENKHIILYRLGEIKKRNGQLKEAIQLFDQVPTQSRYFYLAQYNIGLSYIEANKPQQSIEVFQRLLEAYNSAKITDTRKVVAQISLARAYYQAQDWDKSLDFYRDIPKDHFLWHDALFESSWANLRAAKFRSALSNFQSLHSSFYDDFYLPESLLLRSIVYLYICKYDEMEKVLKLFDKSYESIQSRISSFSNSKKDPLLYYDEIEKTMLLRKDKKTESGLILPYSVARNISEEGDVRSGLEYMKLLAEERQKIESISAATSGSNFPPYAYKIINNRIKNTKITIGESVRVHLQDMELDLRDYIEQAGFIRYEMINGKKEQLKKRIAGKEIRSRELNEEIDRSFYVQNGYEYWPFSGESWLDEVGNFHYLGQQSCE